jgi:hypothetical protein
LRSDQNVKQLTRIGTPDQQRSAFQMNIKRRDCDARAIRDIVLHKPTRLIAALYDVARVELSAQGWDIEEYQRPSAAIRILSPGATRSRLPI